MKGRGVGCRQPVNKALCSIGTDYGGNPTLFPRDLPRCLVKMHCTQAFGHLVGSAHPGLELGQVAQCGNLFWGQPHLWCSTGFLP